MDKQITHKDSDTCERCAGKIECKPDNIADCNCSKVDLSKEEYTFISSKFKMCLCNDCLKELKHEFKISYESTSSVTKIVSTFILSFVFLVTSSAQTYAPPVGQVGTNAIYMDSSVFLNWATSCTVTRGYQDISNTSLGYASVGDNTMATGKAQSNAILSLGDGGSAICTFNKRIANGPGYDFAVFENGFDDVFLELAFVEVSSDGINFFRFPCHSLTDTSVQTGSFGYTDAIKINNLAGKYKGGYGTPFDLQELSGKVGVDINAISHVKIIDVVGSIDVRYASRDSHNNKVNDPWPTPYPSGGFDLDAIGVIHESTITSLKEQIFLGGFSVYPNPVIAGEELKTGLTVDCALELTDASGKSILKTNSTSIQTSGLSQGIYFLKIITESNQSVQKIIVRP